MYVDPNASAPDTQTTRPSSVAPLSEVGAGLGDLVEAASSGSLRVDEATGAATLAAIASIQDQLDAVRRIVATSADGGSRLGGGYAQQIGRFNREWAVDGEAVMDRFATELGRLREAVEMCMTTYRAADEGGERRIDQVGSLITEGNVR